MSCPIAEGHVALPCDVREPIVSLRIVALVTGVGMIIVACGAVWFWRRVSHAPARWFWIGAALWTVAIVVKAVIAILTNAAVTDFLSHRLSPALYLAAGGLYIGVESSLCEIGLTWLVGKRWKQLGEDAGRAIAVGVGAGAFEALLLGTIGVVAIAAWLAGVRGTEPVGEQLQTVAANTPLFWLAGPIERITAIICHAACRGLVLVGTRYGKNGMIALGFLIFTLLDGTAGALQLSGRMSSISLWWIELLLSVFAVASIPALRWLFLHYPAAKPMNTPGTELPGNALD
jgi:uncharacterized membrane protein YhfC